MASIQILASTTFMTTILIYFRKTGVTLQPGVRDEHGLESIDGIFSSPEKSPAKPYGLNQISTISEGESMDIGQSTGIKHILM